MCHSNRILEASVRLSQWIRDINNDDFTKDGGNSQSKMLYLTTRKSMRDTTFVWVPDEWSSKDCDVEVKKKRRKEKDDARIEHRVKSNDFRQLGQKNVSTSNCSLNQSNGFVIRWFFWIFSWSIFNDFCRFGFIVRREKVVRRRRIHWISKNFPKYPSFRFTSAHLSHYLTGYSKN